MIQEESREGIVSYPLDPERFWMAPDALNENLDASGGRCMGIQCNIWKRAMHRRHLRHTLRGGGKHHIGYAALKWQTVLQGTCGELGSYPEIALLPRKTAIFLFEYHGPEFKNVLLPRLPNDRSRTDVHALLKDEQAFNAPYCVYTKFLRKCCVFA